MLFPEITVGQLVRLLQVLLTCSNSRPSPRDWKAESEDIFPYAVPSRLVELCNDEENMLFRWLSFSKDEVKSSSEWTSKERDV